MASALRSADAQVKAQRADVSRPWLVVRSEGGGAAVTRSEQRESQAKVHLRAIADAGGMTLGEASRASAAAVRRPRAPLHAPICSPGAARCERRS